jgi:steroid 5-alpha reductase family enzyme
MLSNPLVLSLIISLVINLVVFAIAYKYQTDKLTDLTYSFTFLLITLAFLFSAGDASHPYRLLIAAMPVLWSIRLGSYLFTRVLTKGVDHRFDEMRPVWWRFGGFWLIQGVSIWVILLAVVVALNATPAQVDNALLSLSLPIGGAIFLFGLLVEAVADAQKFKFRTTPGNEGKFMAEGLFSIVRFPNYAGEILVWSGIFIACIPVLEGLAWATVISPIWITSLLLGLSGIPLLEKSNEEKYGHLPSFQQYRKSTAKLIPGIY